MHTNLSLIDKLSHGTISVSSSISLNSNEKWPPACTKILELADEKQQIKLAAPDT